MNHNLRALLMQVLDKPDDDFFQHIAFEAASESGMTPHRVERLIARVVRCGEWRRLVKQARDLITPGHPDRERLLTALARAARVGRGCPLKVVIRFRREKPRLRRYVVGFRTAWPPPAVVTVGAWWLVWTHANIGTRHAPPDPKPQSLADGWGGYL